MAEHATSSCLVARTEQTAVQPKSLSFQSRDMVPSLGCHGDGSRHPQGGGAQHLVFESLLHSNVVTLVRAGAGVSVPEAEKSALPESRRGGRGDISEQKSSIPLWKC